MWTRIPAKHINTFSRIRVKILGTYLFLLGRVRQFILSEVQYHDEVITDGLRWVREKRGASEAGLTLEMNFAHLNTDTGKTASRPVVHCQCPHDTHAHIACSLFFIKSTYSICAGPHSKTHLLIRWLPLKTRTHKHTFTVLRGRRIWPLLV